MKKVINPIRKDINGNGRFFPVFIKIELKQGNLSITGVEAPNRHGNCMGSCGQIDSTLRKDDRDNWKYVKGWDSGMMDKLLSIWDEWHLNDMNAGTPKQTEFIEKWKSEGNKYDYTKVCEALKEAGLIIDTLTDGTLYQYGTKWLKVDLPQDVIDWLFALPETEVEPAWV